MITKIYCKQCSPHDPTMAIMRCRCLCAKLSFLHRICSSESDNLSSEVYKTLTYPCRRRVHHTSQTMPPPWTTLLPSQTSQAKFLLTQQFVWDLSRSELSVPFSRTCDQAKVHPSQSIVTLVDGSVGWMKVSWGCSLGLWPWGYCSFTLCAQAVMQDCLCW